MPEAAAMDYRKLYDTFVPVLERELGPKDEAVIHPIIGFEFGGPPDLLRFRTPPGIKGVFYVTSDLLFSERQPGNSLGRYEVAICLPAENKLAQDILYKLSQATLEEVFDVGHTADITAWVAPECPLKGLLFTKLASFEFDRQPFGALLCVGITPAELDYALERSSEDLLGRLKAAGVFPVTDLSRQSVV